MVTEEFTHKPVLLNEVLQGLNLRADGCYIDCTFGRGGHSRAILQQLGSNARLIAMDRDPHALQSVDEILKQDKRFSLDQISFSHMKELSNHYQKTGKINGILLDLGVSSPQLDNADRGFSFMRDGILDMRMDNLTGITAAEWLNKATVNEITDVLKTFGEEKFAKRIARAIVSSRTVQPIETTAQLADLVSSNVPVKEKDKHPATRTFQAIRIFINHELDELKQVLDQSLNVLTAGGRLVVISFHSLEDRIVKRFMRSHARGDDYPADIPVTKAMLQPRLKLIGKAIHPDKNEVLVNPRSRSAVLRIAEKVAA